MILSEKNSYCLPLMLGTCGFLLTGGYGGVCAVEPKVIDVGTQKQLFIDDHVIGPMENVSQKFNQPVKYAGNPILEAPAPKPGGMELLLMGGSVMYDKEEKLFKMWYEATDKKRTHSAIAYATSTDGVNWDMPCIGKVSFPEWSVPSCGSSGKDNNFIFDRPAELCPCVYKDPHETDWLRFC